MTVIVFHDRQISNQPTTSSHDIESTELNLGIYYKNEVDKRGRWPAPWTNYGYLKVRLRDGNEFVFTSLMLDLEKLPLNENYRV
ncbi:MAG TPA: hypothetical protein VE467_07010 [Chryseolinea sp.]|nr:hypothetical protein [Chryseolinea sp.]